MNTMELFTVTMVEGNALVSLPMIHVVALSDGKFKGRGKVTTSAGGYFDTVETYSELVQMWMFLTGTGQDED